MPDSSIIGAILSNAGVGCAIMMVLILTGILDTSKNVKRAEDEAAKWYEAWKTSQEVIVELRESLATQTARANVSVEATERLTAMLERRSGER